MKEKIDVKYIANLARIRLDEEEASGLSGQLADILSYIEQLNKLDTSKTDPTTHPLPLMNVFREDETKESLPVSKVLKNAPKKTGSSFEVPKVVEGD